MAAWAKDFDAPIHIHAKDRQWVTEPCSKIEYWEGESLPPLCRCLSTSKDSQEALACYPAPQMHVPLSIKPCTC